MLTSTRSFLRPPDVARLIDATAGRWFTVRFVKRTDGSERRMTCLVGVRKGTTGAGMRYDADARGLRVVWVADRLVHRMIPLDAVLELRIGGKKYRPCSWCGAPSRPQEPGDTYPPYCSPACWGEEHGESGRDDE